jgi:hypothetical protein
MRIDRDPIDRTPIDRQWGIHPDILIYAYADTESDVVARLQIAHQLSGYPDTDSSVHGALLLALATHADSGCDVHGALLLALAGYASSESSDYARLQITHLLKLPGSCAANTTWGKDHLDRAGLDRRYIRSTQIPALGNTSEGFGRLQLTHLLAAVPDTDSDVYARLQLTHLCQAIASSIADVYGGMALVESITFTFSGTLAIGKTICIDGRDFSVLNDGANAIGSFTGEFPAMFRGTNTIIYTDSETGRTVTITVRKMDRKV